MHARRHMPSHVTHQRCHTFFLVLIVKGVDQSCQFSSYIGQEGVAITGAFTRDMLDTQIGQTWRGKEATRW
jgi:hypothetical protein